ncbi:TolC family protein [Paludisphaera soli]|uniref:TolC family protein n=1 Tax=Paludisphaera soli TaxID=2712865 RepID=UPI001F0F61F7|nr:TolC family protein [Paludisphaera soli]
MIRRHSIPYRWDLAALLAVVLAVGASRAAAQGPTVDAQDSARVPSGTTLGPLPGSGGTRGGAPADIGTILGGRPGPSVPRAPTGITRPGPGFGIRPTEGVTLPPALPFTEAPLYGPLSIPPSAEDEGPPDGLTLDAAIDRLVGENLELRSQYHEIPKARADVLTASLRANPIFYADSQLIPYGDFSEKRPGGATQYDVNVTYPLDVSHKRQARTAVAAQAVRVIEAQYQDAVRRQIDALYEAYVTILGARETVRYARASVIGLEQLLEKAERLLTGGERSRGDVERIRVQLNAARVGLADAEEALLSAKRPLTPLLRIPLAEVESLELLGTVGDQSPPPPPGEALIQMAFEARPDLAASRLGIALAQADVKLAKAERYQDVYLLAQPYTFQNNAPFGTKSAHSWAVGVTVPLPIYNRNQGNIQRAYVNVSQTRTQLHQLELTIATEVRQAEREYLVTREAVDRIERELLPGARSIRDEALRRYNEGEAALVDLAVAQREYNEIVRQYRDTQVRHRRSMLGLNTAVGRRVLP